MKIVTIKTRLRETLIKLTGYWIYKHRDIPIGCDIESDLQKRVFQNIKTIFDVGANIGQTAIKFNRSFKESIIYCFEPVNKPFKQLSFNTSTLDNVKCFNLALGDKPEIVKIDVYEGNNS